MDLSAIKEELSIAYISSICAIVGIDYERTIHDNDSTDALIKCLITLENGTDCLAMMRIQLKSTSSTSQYTETADCIRYKLKAKNYNDLCGRATTPFVLMLLILPEEESEWLKWTSEELILRGRMYWQRFAECAATKNTDRITVEIPKSNVVNTETIMGMMKKIATEEWV